MGKKDYLDKIVSKIYNRQSKIKVLAEIEDHLDENINKFKEIGYDDEIAESKAIELMGDDEIVAQQLGQIHNKKPSPVFAIVAGFLWLSILGGLYYLMKTFVFSDIGASSLILGAFAISYGICFGFGAFSLKKANLHWSLCSFVGTVATCLFNYFTLCDLNKTMRGKISNLVNFIINHKLVPRDTSKNDDVVITVVCIAGFFVLLFILLSVAYYAKTKALSNTRTDNKIRKQANNIAAYISILLLCIGILFCTKTFYDINKIYDEYVENYHTVLEISQKCNTKEDVCKYITDNGLDFEARTDLDGEITKYVYESGIGSINISFSGFNEEEIVTPQDYYTQDATVDSIIDKMYQIANEAGVFVNNEPSTIYSIEFDASIVKFKNGYDSLTLRKKKTDYKDITKFSPDFKSSQEKFEFYSSLVPKRLYFEKTDAKYYDKNYKFYYVVDFKGISHYQNDYSISLASNQSEEYLSTRQTVIDIINANPDATNEEIASLTGTVIVKPTVPQVMYDILPLLKDYDEYVNSTLKNKAENSNNVLGYVGYEEVSFYDAYKNSLTKLEQAYKQSIYFEFDNGLQFSIIDGEIYAVIFAENFDTFDNEMLKEHKIDNVKMSSVFNDVNIFDKCSFNGYYYDSFGNCYTDCERIVYYDRNGNEFIYYLQKITDDDSTTRDEYKHYFTDGKNYYPSNRCYVDQNGYFVYDSNGNIHSSGVDSSLTDAQGNVYFAASNTSWDSQGNKYARKYANRDIELWQEITQ